ncbi:MAG: TIGR03000 domain-containing protein [Gemmataceae bacterium]|nr:TIGR03000 domain-containing protein [Gemmataceae bacterium]MDW8264855.1 TIGR03000 domain-containing protein [Gemmataceae bacterium]
MYVDGEQAPLTSAKRTFQTPPLQQGRDYFYTIKAEMVRGGRTVSESKRVIVRAGQVSRVRFEEPEVATARTRITVQLPADAKLYVNGDLCPLTTATRRFDTPELPTGQTYAYTFRAEVERAGRTVSANRTVVFRAGEPVTVDFGTLVEVQTASR